MVSVNSGGSGYGTARYRSHEPKGKITDARTPIAVTVTIQDFWRQTWVQKDGWAIAWTAGEVLVVWRDEGKYPWPVVVWHPAYDVKRR